MKRYSSNQTRISNQDALAAYPNRADDNKQPIVSRLFNRRQFIGAGIATGAVIGSMSLNGCVTSPTAQEKVNIVIVGAGIAGLAVANRLSRQLPNATLTILDNRQAHYYQPGYTLLATGVWNNTDKVIDSNANLLPAGINWIQENAREFSPDNNQVITESGKKNWL